MSEVIKIKGLSELQRALFKFNSKLGEKVTQLALKHGAAHVRDQIKQASPVKTGRLKRSVRIRVSKRQRVNKTGSVGVYILVGGGKRSNSRSAYYAKFVEYGYNRGSQLITGSQGVQRGLLSQAEYQRRRLVNLQTALQRRKPGRKLSVGGIRLRSGGKAVAGLHYIERAFIASAGRSIEIIQAASVAALTAAAKENNLQVK